MGKYIKPGLAFRELDDIAREIYNDRVTLKRQLILKRFMTVYTRQKAE